MLTANRIWMIVDCQLRGSHLSMSLHSGAYCLCLPANCPHLSPVRHTYPKPQRNIVPPLHISARAIVFLSAPAQGCL